MSEYVFVLGARASAHAGVPDGDRTFIVLSRTTKGQNLSLPIPCLDFRVTAEQDAVLVTTYMQEAEFNVT